MSSSHLDCNLLFGILALQLDFISRDALIAAMHAWVLNKQKPLGQILLEQGALAPDAQAVLDALVKKHLDLHHGDPQQSLAAIGLPGAMRRDLAQFADPDVQASLVRVAAIAPLKLSQQTTLPMSEKAPADERFEILRSHAWGGLGEVYVAQDREVNREVALKRLHERHADNADSRARFLREAEITGGLEHPGIVPVYGLGTGQDGRPYYAMRFIRGQTLKEAVERFHTADARTQSQRRIELRQLLGRFLAVCNAVEYAHSRGVIHRDLKPSNIMLGKYGETLVVDWGLFKALGHGDPRASPDEQTLVPSSGSGSSETLPGSTIGTPAYMSPEQSEGRIENMGPASDVYSLGATLYTILTGKEPFESTIVGVVLGKVQLGDFTPPRERNPSVPRALNAICLKAMRLSPKDRYPSCAALASDIEHWLADEPVAAFEEPLSAQAFRWIRTHRVVAARVAGLMGGLFVGLVMGTILLGRANSRIADEVTEKESERKEATHQREVAEQQRAEADRQRNEASKQLYVSQMNLAQRAWDDNNVGRTRELLEIQKPQNTGGLDLRGWEWRRLWRIAHSERRVIKVWSLSIAFTPDGQFLISGGDDGTLKIWTADGTRAVRTIPAHNGRLDRLAVSGDGKLLATAGNGAVKLWDIPTGRELRSIGLLRGIRGGLAISRDGTRLAVSCHEGLFRGIGIWSTADGKQTAKLKNATNSTSLDFHPDGIQLAAIAQDSSVRLWNVLTGEEVRKFVGHPAGVTAVAISPDGRALVAGSYDGALMCWDLRTAKELFRYKGHAVGVNQIAFSSDGKAFATGSDDTVVKVWDLASGQEIHAFRGHASQVSGVAYSPRGDVIASGGWDESIRLWDAASAQEPSWHRCCGPVTRVAYSPDSRWLAPSEFGFLAVVDSSTGLPNWIEFPKLGAPLTNNIVQFDSAGKVLAVAKSDGIVELRQVKSGSLLSSFRADKQGITSLDLSPDGQTLATASSDRSVALWNRNDGHRLAEFQGHTDRVNRVTFSPDGRLLASAGHEGDKTVRLWDIATHRALRTLVGHEGAVLDAVFSRDGKQLFTCGVDEMIRTWDVATGAAVGVRRGHSGTVFGLSLSPDGKRLASCSHDQTVKIWDVATGYELQTLATRAGQILSVAFSPDGTQLAAGTINGQTLIWDARPLTPEGREQIVAANPVASPLATDWLTPHVTGAVQAETSFWGSLGKFFSGTLRSDRRQPDATK